MKNKNKRKRDTFDKRIKLKIKEFKKEEKNEIDKKDGKKKKPYELIEEDLF